MLNGYAALGLMYFFTAGEDEVKAWTIQVRIHQNIEMLFHHKLHANDFYVPLCIQARLIVLFSLQKFYLLLLLSNCLLLLQFHFSFYCSNSQHVSSDDMPHHSNALFFAWFFIDLCFNQKHTKAPQAAGKIHTDFEKGFIMADVMKFSDFKEEGSEAAVKVGSIIHEDVLLDENYIFEPSCMHCDQCPQ